MAHYKHLSCEERDQIGSMRAAGASLSAIGHALQRSPSSISRELNRNCLPSGGYSARHADGAYIQRRHRDAILEEDEKLQAFVIQRLAEGWSPSQISGWLTAGHERLRSLCPETIYRFIYRISQKTRQLWRYLNRRRKHRRPFKSRPSRDKIKDRNSIHDRPQDIETREEFGHWEGDLMICNRTRPVLVLHERKSRVTLATRLQTKSAENTAEAMLNILSRFDKGWRRSITFDNGTEFALHTLLKDKLGMSTWFCDAYASWQKGGVENANGRLRLWLPRNCDLDEMSDEQIQDIVMSYNLTPRKCLGWLTPLQAFFKENGKDIKISFA